MASAQNFALGPFLFWADHLVLKRHALRIVFLKASVVANTLMCSGSRTCLLVLT
jgi:hypothetical protein